METLVACSLVASEQEQVEKKDETRKSEGSWTIWNRGGVIGAAAVTGGTLMAVSGGNISVQHTRSFLEICDNSAFVELLMILNRISCPSNCTWFECSSS